MSDPTRERILVAFDRELEASPLPPGLRERTIRAAVTSPGKPARVLQPSGILAVIALVVVVALVAMLILVRLRPAPTPAHSSVPPPPRSLAAVAYDKAHGDLVLFGGVVGSGNDASAVNETWTWDGKYWTHQHSAVSPPPGNGALMAYDEVRHEVVLYAGGDGLNRPSETWMWNGSTWRQLHPLHAPPALSYASAQFDPITRAVLLYGSTADQKPQMWSWKGSDWVQLNPAALPGGFTSSMVFGGDHVLLLSPTPGLIGGRFFTQTWSWDGSAWNLLNPALNLPPLGYPISSAYDTTRGRVLLFAGDTWSWDGSTWARQHPSLQPLRNGYMAYMPSLDRVVSWGSVSDNTDGEMYAWDGTNWTLIQAGPRPEASDRNGGYLGWMTPAQAAAIVRATVTKTQPVLLPTSLPDGPWDASVAASAADGFSVTYASDDRSKNITLGAVVANPPLGDTNSSDTYVRFRSALPLKYQRAGYAEYFVYDPSAPLSQRWLMWIEPGTMWVGDTSQNGVWYFLSASGLTDQEFWQVADSLR